MPRVFAPLLPPARYKGAHGGRGSGKSHFFAEMLIKRCIETPGLRAVCIREVQKSLSQSVKQLIEDKIAKFGLTGQFEVLESEIRPPGGGLIIFQGMQNHTAHTIKSLEGFDIAWVEEAQSLSRKSLNMLRPTIRKEGSEIWFSWNPDNENDPVDRFLRGERPPGSVVVEANFHDNPWLPKELLAEQEIDKADPDKFSHVWLGGYAKSVEGAYYAEHLRQAEIAGRITPLALDPLQSIYASWDLGVADATAIWISQSVGAEIRLIDYIEGQGQPLAYYLNQLRARGYEAATCILPHDGAHRDAVTATRFEDHIRAAGFTTEVIRNQGRGAAMQRIEAARRWFPRMWFDTEKTMAGRAALAAYHERRDDSRNIGLGPEHDWSSHACLAAGSLVETARGMVPIEAVRIGDRVATPAGFANVQWAGMVKVAEELVKVALDNGAFLLMTPEHKVFTTRGVVESDTLRYGDAVIIEKDAACLELASADKMGYRAAFSESFGASDTGSGRSAGSMSAKSADGSVSCTERLSATAAMKSFRSTAIGKIFRLRTGSSAPRAASETSRFGMNGRTSTVSATTGARSGSISHGGILALSTCIAPFGSTITGRSQMDTTSITSTMIRPITGLRTWWRSLRQSMRAIMPRLMNGLGARPTNANSAPQAINQNNGTPAQRGGSGTASTESVRGSFARSMAWFASIAPRLTKRSGRAERDFAARVVSVERIAQRAPVYDLTVEHHHCYFANGMLVSNSDAFGLMALAYREPTGAIAASLPPRKMNWVV